ncbi:MAG TPA: MipA/OmpV family protein [Desulfuromonadales bacterium]|nr:MipA/OmpV family protein [Desulfuromonadales bacterium]
MTRLAKVTSFISKTITTAVLGSLFLSPAGEVQAESATTKSEDQTISTAALAGNPREGTRAGWKFSVGAGALYAPAFAGSKDYQLMVFPDVKIAFKDLFFASVKDGVGYNVIRSDGWRIGPVVKYKFERKEDGSNPFRVGGGNTTALKGLGTVDATFEWGGFAEYGFEPFACKVELRQGMDGHKGMIGEAGINYAGAIERFGPPMFFAVGPRATIADSEYINAYFGISQTQSVRSGLARYNAGGGVVSYGFGGFMSIPLAKPFAVALFGGYDRLGNKVADSPLIGQRGSENQFAIGLSVNYKFDMP